MGKKRLPRVMAQLYFRRDRKQLASRNSAQRYRSRLLAVTNDPHPMARSCSTWVEPRRYALDAISSAVNVMDQQVIILAGRVAQPAPHGEYGKDVHCMRY